MKVQSLEMAKYLLFVRTRIQVVIVHVPILLYEHAVTRKFKYEMKCIISFDDVIGERARKVKLTKPVITNLTKSKLERYHSLSEKLVGQNTQHCC